ncbi:MAG: cupin-like domain-containing protein [Gammaproteobacteria bacterium]|nr:cupin-like domain-containing protein [Gammaproteobacteria bacterium]
MYKNSLGDQKTSELSRDWRLWVAENALRKCDKVSMAQTMIQAGVDESVAKAGIDAVMSDPIFEAALKHQQITFKYASVMENYHQLLLQNPDYDQIDRRKQLSKSEFLEKYYLGNKPVVITDFAKNWPALSRWTPRYFKETYGDVQVEAQIGRNKDPHYELNKANHRCYFTMSDFIDRVEALDNSNDIYLTANNDALRAKEFKSLFNDIGPLPDYMNPDMLENESSLWIGPGGTITPLHHDSVHLFHVQIMGRKRWRFIHPMQIPRMYNFNGYFSPIDIDAPDLARFPLFKDVKILDVTVGPGEAVFLPLAWWHHVVSLDICISVSLANIAYRNLFEYDNPSNTNWY